MENELSKYLRTKKKNKNIWRFHFQNNKEDKNLIPEKHL